MGNSNSWIAIIVAFITLSGAIATPFIKNRLKQVFDKSVKYRNTIKLQHVKTGHLLHSHSINYKHSQSSGQQQVTCFGETDINDYWIIIADFPPKNTHKNP